MTNTFSCYACRIDLLYNDDHTCDAGLPLGTSEQNRPEPAIETIILLTIPKFRTQYQISGKASLESGWIVQL